MNQDPREQSYFSAGHYSRKRPGILCCLLLMVPTCLVSQVDSIDAFLLKNMQSHHIPGASLAVSKNGRVIKSSAYGLSNIESRTPASIGTVYEIGSLTKQFTAMAIMLLMEEGKLEPENKITRFFPDAPPGWNNITIRHLLTHTSGIQNHVAVPGYLDTFKMNLRQQSYPSQKDILEMFFQLPLEFPAGETWSYDNTGYYLLGLIIEKLSGQSYWDFLEERLFKTLGMKNTRNTDSRDIVHYRASGYVWQDSLYKNQPDLWPFVGFSAGSLMSTVEDLSIWDAALYSEKLVKRKTLEEMWRPARSNSGNLLPFNCGMGWFIDAYHGHPILQHSGGTPGFSSVIYRFPADTLCVILLTNHADIMIDQLALDIAGYYDPALKRPMVSDDPSPVLTSRLKTIFNELLQGNFNPEDFTPEMKTFLGTTTGQSLWQWYSSFGELGTFKFVDKEKRGLNDVYRYRIQLGNNIYLFTFTISKDNKIVQIYFS